MLVVVVRVCVYVDRYVERCEAPPFTKLGVVWIRVWGDLGLGHAWCLGCWGCYDVWCNQTLI